MAADFLLVGWLVGWLSAVTLTLVFSLEVFQHPPVSCPTAEGALRLQVVAAQNDVRPSCLLGGSTEGFFVLFCFTLYKWIFNTYVLYAHA